MCGFNLKENKKNMEVRELLGLDPVSLSIRGVDCSDYNADWLKRYEDGDCGNLAEGTSKEDLVGLYHKGYLSHLIAIMSTTTTTLKVLLQQFLKVFFYGTVE